MIDTGSQISLVSTDFVQQHRHIIGSMITPMKTPCSLKLATGKTSNPFKGKIKLDLRFIDIKGQLTKKAEVEFHVLKQSSEINSLLLGLNFLIPVMSEIKFVTSIVNMKIDKRFYNVPFIQEDSTNIFFMATDDFTAGSGLLTCFCNSLILESNYYDVPHQYKYLLGSNVIFLQPGSCKKRKNKENLNQVFVF